MSLWSWSCLGLPDPTPTTSRSCGSWITSWRQRPSIWLMWKWGDCINFCASTLDHFEVLTLKLQNIFCCWHGLPLCLFLQYNFQYRNLKKGVGGMTCLSKKHDAEGRNRELCEFWVSRIYLRWWSFFSRRIWSKGV